MGRIVPMHTGAPGFAMRATWFSETAPGIGAFPMPAVPDGHTIAHRAAPMFARGRAGKRRWRSNMSRWAVLLVCMVLAACASAPPPSPTASQLFHDDLFEAPSQRIQADDLFALSDRMKRYVDFEIAGQLRTKGPQKGLLDALYSKQQLKLEYDSERTRNAMEAFDARSGNCLSLVIMTAAFAKHLGMEVSYQSVYADETWTRNQDTYFSSNHVNLTLGKRWVDAGNRGVAPNWTIDFLPPEDTRNYRTRAISEETVVAMYMNNRAVEAMAAGQLNDAYWWARAAMAEAPAFLSAYNTLGVIYLRRGQPAVAEKVLAHVLERDTLNTISMANMVRVLQVQGRTDAARQLAQRLASIDPEPPFHFFDLGRNAMRQGDYRNARTLFAKEIARAPYHHEFHFWLAMADFQLGDIADARKHLTLAMNMSTNRSNQQLYAAKLDLLKQRGLQ
jgi:tetratricopeptide (TPR) repeat protein